MQALASPLLVNGLRQEFNDTYSKIQNRQSVGWLPKVMEIGIGTDNRYQDFGYWEAGPHFEYWPRGTTLPMDAMASVRFRGVVHNWGRGVEWHADDRADDQTQSLMETARKAGESFGLLDERMFFDLLTGGTTTLPAVPTAPDGAAFFATTTGGGGARFGVSGGNLLTGTGVAAVATIIADYYAAIEQFLLMQDGKGQPLFTHDIIQGGVMVLHAAADLQIFETAFLQIRQGIVMGTDAGTTPSNIIKDASRYVEVVASPRLATGDWYVFLLNTPKKPAFTLERQALQEHTALVGDNNSDEVRKKKMESIGWDARRGAGIALPYGAIKINN